MRRRPVTRRRLRVPGILAGIALAAGCATYGSRPGIEPGVRRGDELVESRLLYQRPGFHPRELTWATPDDGETGVLVAGGPEGAAFLTADGNPLRFVPVEPKLGIGFLRPVAADGDPALELIDPGGGWQPVGLFDDDGTLLWKFSGSFLGSPDAMAVGNLDGDGEVDFVVGMNGRGGLRILGLDGKERRRLRGANVFEVVLLDSDGDGLDEILHSQGGGNDPGVWLRSSTGERLRRVTDCFSDFVQVHGTPSGTPPRIAGWCSGEVRIMDLEGRVLHRIALRTPGHSPSDVLLLPPRRAGGSPLVAVARTLQAVGNRSELVVAEDGRILYHEVFDVPFLAAAAAPSREPVLLLAAGDRIVRLQFADEAPTRPGD